MIMQTNNESTQGKVLLWICVIVGLLAVVTVTVMYARMKREAQEEERQQADQIPRTQLDTSVVPTEFPAGLPLEAGAPVTQNFTAEGENGLQQSTREFVTERSLAQNFEIYSDFFKRDGWKIQNTTDTEYVKSISAIKGDLQAQVLVNDNTISHVKTVTINITKVVQTAPTAPESN
jgi:hypothetical protein